MRKIEVFSTEEPSILTADGDGKIVSYISFAYDITQSDEERHDEESGEVKIVKGWRYTLYYSDSPLSIDTYEGAVSALIRLRYTVDDEVSILRQRDEKPKEFSEYSSFAEYAKRVASSAFVSD